ncbi:hypothetical protein ACX84Z_29995, partial [Burkholderia pseudomallei]
GSGLGSIALPRLLNAARAVLGAACEARLRIDTRTVPLADVDAHSIALPRLLNAARAVLGAACEARLRIDTRTVPLADVDAHWGDTGSTLRPVFTMRAPG